MISAKKYEFAMEQSFFINFIILLITLICLKKTPLKIYIQLRADI